MLRDKKLATERLGQGKMAAQPSETTLLATIAVGFLVLHILVGVILLRTPANGMTTFREEAASSLYD